MKINFSSGSIDNWGDHSLRRKKGGGVNDPRQNIGAGAQNFDRPASQNGISGSVCFKGGIVSAVQKIGEDAANTIKLSDKIATKIATSEKFNKVAKYVLHNEAMFSALVSLGLVSTIRPIFTMMMPVADGKDKVAVASKEIVGGVVGYGLATLIAKPVNVAVIKLTKNPNKYIKNDNPLVKKLATDDAYLKMFTSFWKNIPEMGMSVIKGAITVALMPFVIKAIDYVRDKNKKPAVISTSDKVINYNIYQLSNKETFQKLSGGAK